MADLDPNRYASPDEAALLHEDIAAAEAAKLDLEGHISHAAKRVHDAMRALQAAEGAHAELVARRDILDLRVLRARGLLHPIRRLPNELLAMIFEHWRQACVHEDRFENPVHLPLYAGAVCRLWRHIASNMPRLWNVVKLDLMDVDSHNIDSWSEYLDTYRTRSGIWLLHVEVCGGWNNLTGLPAAAKFWNALDRCFARAHTIDMEVSGCDLDPNVKDCIRASRPNLKSFTFSVDLDYDADTHFFFLRSAPQLQNVCLWGVTPLWGQEDTFPAVKTVSIHEINADGLLNLFHHMPNVNDLTLTGFNISAHRVLHGFSVRSDSVVWLDIDVGELADVRVAQSMRFPSLKKAILSCRNRHSVSDDTLTALFRHVLVTVEDFTYGEQLDSVALVEGLRALTSVKTLQFQHFGKAAEGVLLEMSRPDSRGAWLFPKLDRLVLCDKQPSDSLSQAILRLARARGACAPSAIRPPQALQSLTFRDFTFPSRRLVKGPLSDEINAILATA